PLRELRLTGYQDSTGYEPLRLIRAVIKPLIRSPGTQHPLYVCTLRFPAHSPSLFSRFTRFFLAIDALSPPDPNFNMTIPRSTAFPDALTSSAPGDDATEPSLSSLGSPAPVPASDPPVSALFGKSPSVPGDTRAVAPMVDDEPIRITVIPPSMLKRWDDALLLDLTAGNYCKWKKELHEVLSVCDTLDMYTSPSYACPPGATRLEDARKWVINDRHVQAFITIDEERRNRLLCSELPRLG
ncbi:hypothetical protein OH77DRAFT_1549758, partial [Trametes cingulata]